MRKVVDSNMLREGPLRQFLAASRSNCAVLTDYAAMEAYKINSLEALRRSMAILMDYPNQVLVLKGTQALCGMNARGAGLQRRMIDEVQTRGFGDFCKTLRMATDKQLRDQFDEFARAADHQMERMLKDAKTTPEAITLVEKSYTGDELRIFRRGEPYTSVMLEKMGSHIIQLAGELFKTHPKARPLKRTEEWRNTYLFRTALAMYLLALRWIAVGGAQYANATKIRNDMIDVNFAASATYFDGLLSADQKLLGIYQEARFVLENLFGGKAGRSK